MPRGTVRGTTDPARHPERTRMRRGRPLTGEHATVVALLGGNKLESSTSDSCPGEALQLDLFCCRLILKHVGRNGIIIIYLSVSIEMETLIIDFIRTPPTFIRTCTDECGNPIP